MMRSVSGFTGWAGLLLIAAVAVAVAGCGRFMWVPEPAPIAVPDDLSSDDVGSILRRAIIQTGTGQYRGESWRVEEDSHGELIVSTSPRRHYLQLVVEYDANRVITRITDGPKLRQSSRERKTVHPRAIEWKTQLEEHFHRALYEESLNRREAQP